ncbi:MAG: GAF domain-containing protein [Nostoc sp. TH1S01]|nr:GAF domain-containing protein [Nostoc sp. TH1S01]
MLNHITALTPAELKSAIVPHPLIVEPDTTVTEVITQMSGVRNICDTTYLSGQLDELYLEARSSCVLVVENGCLLGIFTERDVVRLSAENHAWQHLAIREVMIYPVVTLHESDFTDILSAVNLLQQYHIRHIPILNEQEQVVGLVTHESLRHSCRPVDLLRLRLVSEVMITEVICAAPDSSMLAIAQLMAKHRISSVMIVETAGSPNQPLQLPLGIITERDIVQFQALGLNLQNCLAQMVMSSPIFTVKPDDSLLVVQQLMEQRLIKRLAVTGKQGELLGIVTQTNLLQALNPLELYNLAAMLEQRVVQLEAEHVAILENRTVELEQQVDLRTSALQAKVRQEKLIAEITAQIRSSLSLQTILNTTVEKVRHLLGCDRVNIWQFDADGQMIVVAESSNSPISLVGEQIHDSCFQQYDTDIDRWGQIRVVSDVYTTQISECHRNMLISLHTRAKILVPLLRGDQLWGLLNATESQHAREWQPEEIELLQALSVHLAIALQQATTHQKLQEELRDFFDNATDLIQSIAPDGQILFVNRSWKETLGYDDTDLVQLSIFQVIHPDELVHCQTAMQSLFAGALCLGIETRFLTKEGREIIVEGNVHCQLQHGQPIATRGIFRDITARKQAEKTIYLQIQREKLLREISQRIRESLDLQTIFHTACQEIRQVIQADRVGIFKFYPESNFDDGEFVAESVKEGLTSVVAIRVHDHCFGENYSSLYAKGQFFAVDDIYNNGLTTCHSHILAQFQVRSNLVIPLLCGHELWGLLCIHQCAAPRQWQESEIEFTQQLSYQLAIAIQQANLYEQIQAELLVRQQTEAKLTETNHKLAISNQELARATRLKDEFLANMSHELRTPLNAILGMTEGLQDEIFGIINEQQLKALQTIERSGSHLLELINDILDVAKIESGQIKLDYTLISVTHLCQSSLAFIKQQALQKQIQVELKCPLNLPEILVDERRIRQVLLNLLNNAVKFTPNGGRITLAVTQISSPPNFLHFAVTDTGIGISPENIKKLFQPFVQIDSDLNRQYTGTGLGLTLVKQIVEIHGGRVGLTSELGMGSCFTIDLPCHPISDISPAITTGTQAISNSELGFSSNDEKLALDPLILLAEDNEANISTVSSYLEAKGYRILLAMNGQEAIDFTKAHHPNLILMDIQMPKIDGLEAIKQIRQDPQFANVPIVALTALAMSGDRERCLAAGANDYLSKPVKLKELATTIKKLLI